MRAKDDKRPSTTMQIPIKGLPPKDEASVRDLLADIAPIGGPANGIIFLPGPKFNEMANGVAAGNVGGRLVNQGRPPVNPDGGFSQIGQGVTYISADLLRNPSKLRGVISHELGHFAAYSQNTDTSEEAANDYRGVYLKRAQQAAKIDAGTQAQPVSTQQAPGILSGSIKDVQPPAAPQGGVLGGISNQGQTK